MNRNPKDAFSRAVEIVSAVVGDDEHKKRTAIIMADADYDVPTVKSMLADIVAEAENLLKNL